VGGFRLVEAKYPALLFKQQLDAFVQKIFPMMRDNVKKNITPMLVRTCSGTTLLCVFLLPGGSLWCVRLHHTSSGAQPILDAPQLTSMVSVCAHCGCGVQGQCIHTPRGAHSRGATAALSRRPSAAAGDAAAANLQNKAWSDILTVFDDLLTKLKGEGSSDHSCCCVWHPGVPLCDFSSSLQ
jgi:hypothetical protein